MSILFLKIINKNKILKSFWCENYHLNVNFNSDKQDQSFKSKATELSLEYLKGNTVFFKIQ